MRLRIVALAAGVLAAVAASGAAQEGARRDQPAKPKPKEPQLTRPPDLIEAAPPDYPPAAAAAKLEADVTVRISIDAAGAVDKVDVVTPAGHGFDEAAAAAARGYRFRPAEFDGKPGAITVETTIHFKILPESMPAALPASEPSPSAPPATLTGTVKERGTRRRLAGIAVALDQPDGGKPAVASPTGQAEPSLETATAADGTFRFAEVPPGAYHMVVLAPGFDKLTVAVTLAPGETTETAVYLRPAGGNPYETVVVGERERLEVTRRTLNRRELTTVPGTFGDPIRVIQTLPGVARAPFASGLLIIRGSNPNESGVFIDGFQVPLLFHFLGGPSILNPEFLESLDLYPGGFPSRFGRVIGGVVEVNTRSPASDGVHGSANVDLLDSGAYVRAPIAKHVSFAAAARRSYIDALLPLVLPKPSNPGDTLVVVPVYWDYQTRVELDFPGRDKLSLLVFGSDDSLSVSSTSLDNATTFDLDTHIGFHRAILTYKTKIAGGLDFSLAQVLGRDVLSLSAGMQTSTEVVNTITGFRERISGQLRPGLRVDTGVDLEYRLTDYQLKIPNSRDFRTGGELVDIPAEVVARTVDRYGVAAYAELAWDVTPRLRLIPSLRADLYLLNGNRLGGLDPRLVARYAHSPRTTFKGYVGWFHQPPEPETLDNLFGNPDLGLEDAVQTGFGVEQKLGKHILIDAETYYVARRDLTALSTQIASNPDGTVRPEVFNNSSHGNSYGLEILIKHEVTEGFYGWLSYTLSHADVQPQPDVEVRPTTFDQTHNLSAVASWRAGEGWELGARFRLSTGRPITPILGSTYDADRDAFVRLNGPIGSERRVTFHELDLRIDKTWLFETWMIGVYLDVINAYNAENPEATQYDYRFRDTAPVRGVPIIPTLGVKGQW